MKLRRRNLVPIFLVVLFTTTLEVTSLSDPIDPEYKYKERDENQDDHRYEGIRKGSPIAGEYLKLLSAAIQPQNPWLFDTGDLTNPTGLAVKLRDAQHPLSRHLRQQFSTDMRSTLDEYDEADVPSEAFRKALLSELNRLLKGTSLYDAERFAQVALRERTRRLIEQERVQVPIYLNRLLLEDAYPEEFSKTQYHPVDPSKPIERLKVGFFLNESKPRVGVTVGQYRKRYCMDAVRTEYQAGFNEFSWDAKVVNGLGIDFRSLHATVEVERNPNIIAPAILYHDPLPRTLKVREYQFVFVPNVKCDLEYKILYDREIKSQGSLRERPARQPTLITWDCQDASEEWYQLWITYSFKGPFRPRQEIHVDYRFYHKPALDIPKG